jgi:hypothetical protein
VTDGGWFIESVSGYTSAYTPGQIGVFSYAEQFTLDNLRYTPIDPAADISDYVTFCNGRGKCSGEHRGSE